MGSLGEKMKALRKERRITQQELAKGLVTASMISQIESDKATPSQQLLEQLADRLGVKPAYFADDIIQKSDLAQTYRRAKILLEAENYEVALPLLLSLLESPSPQFREETLYGELAQCYEKLNRFPEACEMYENVARTSLVRDNTSSAIYAYYHLGQVHRRCQEAALAKMYWQRAADLMTRHPDIYIPLSVKVYSNLGRAHFQLREYTWAMESYRKAEHFGDKYGASDLEMAMIHHGTASAYMELGMYEEAHASLAEAQERYEKVHHQRGVNQCAVNLGVNLKLQGNLDGAIRQLTNCVQNRDIHSDSIRLANALSERADCYLRKGNWPEAERDAHEALTTDKESHPLQCSARIAIGQVCMATSRYEEALKWIDEAYEFAVRGNDLGASAQLLSMRADVLDKLGRFDVAGQSVEQLLQLADTAIFPRI